MPFATRTPSASTDTTTPTRHHGCDTPAPEECVHLDANGKVGSSGEDPYTDVLYFGIQVCVYARTCEYREVEETGFSRLSGLQMVDYCPNSFTPGRYVTLY